MKFNLVSLNLLGAALALGLGAGAANAQEYRQTNNTQIDLSSINAQLNTTVSNVNGDVGSTAAAIGNS